VLIDLLFNIVVALVDDTIRLTSIEVSMLVAAWMNARPKGGAREDGATESENNNPEPYTWMARVFKLHCVPRKLLETLILDPLAPRRTQPQTENTCVS
jgi:hypothetical protein